MPPRLWKKGVGAEADALAGILAGSTDKIRGAVAFLCEGLFIKTPPGWFLWDSLWAIFFYLIIIFERFT